MNTVELWTTSWGLGKLPWAPAVWACLPPVIAYQVLGYLAPAASAPVMLAFTLAGSIACLRYGPQVVRQAGESAPASLVADRTAGQGLTLFMIALLAPANICNSMALGFVLFRLFDLLRPWPCRLWRRCLCGGLNRLAESWIAGLYAGVVACAAMALWPSLF